MDKAAHFVMYGVLGFLATQGWRHAGRRPRLLWVLVLASLVGAVDEYRQRSVANRAMEAADWVADTIGIGAAAWLVLRQTGETKKNVV